jgi:alkylation response protein AidB-like acyl-CoA dehydrogenase
VVERNAVNFDLSDEQARLAEQVLGVLSKPSTYDHLRREIADVGVLGAAIAEVYGALGITALDLAAISEAPTCAIDPAAGGSPTVEAEFDRRPLLGEVRLYRKTGADLSRPLSHNRPFWRVFRARHLSA